MSRFRNLQGIKKRTIYFLLPPAFANTTRFQLRYYDLKQENLRRKYKKFHLGWTTWFGLFLNFAMIFMVSCAYIGFMIWANVYEVQVMDDFSFHTQISLNNDLFFFKTEMIKSKIDKMIADYSGKNSTVYDQSNFSAAMQAIQAIAESRKNDTKHLFDYVYGLQANSSETFGFNQYH